MTTDPTIFDAAISPLQNIFSAVGYVWPFVLPPLLWFLFRTMWKPHIWGHFGSTQKKVLLEIVPPRDIESGPLPMEYFFSALAGSEKGLTTYEIWVDGEFQPQYALELVSTEGVIHFYIRCWAAYRNLVEANLYAQYPGVEIYEVEDYTKKLPEVIPNNEWNLWGTDYVLSKPDVYPIRTYKFFEESVTGKMVDPLASFIELMTTIGPGQHLWVQYIISASKPNWNETVGKKQIDEWLAEKTEVKEGEQAGPLEFRLTPGERDVLKAMQSNNSKVMFDVKMRHVYVGRREVFNKGTGVSGTIGSIKQFNDHTLNGFKPGGHSKTKTDYYKSDKRLKRLQREILHRYRHRDREPYDEMFMLSSEELATVFHLPDMSVTAPTLQRVAAKRGSAPMNLPVEL